MAPFFPSHASCTRQWIRQHFHRLTRHQTRAISKKAREEERNVIVKLLKDVPRFGPAGMIPSKNLDRSVLGACSYMALNPSAMRNRWFPARVADYVPFTQVKHLKAQNIDMARRVNYGVQRLEEEEEEQEADSLKQADYRVRPIEIDMLGPERSMELIDTFVPQTIDFYRQAIEKDREPTERIAASGAADVLTAMLASKAKSAANAIYGSVSAADIVSTIKGALAHNDEAARVILNEADVRFTSGHEEGDTSRVKQLGTFKIEIQVPGVKNPLVRSVRVRAKGSKS